MFVERRYELIERLAGWRASAERAVLFTVVEGTGAGREAPRGRGRRAVRRRLPDEALGQVDELLRGGRNRLLELDDGSKVFAEWYGPPPRLFVYGAVDTAEALCRGGEAARLDGDRRRRAREVRHARADPERRPS